MLNAADPNVAAMAITCPGSVIFFAADRAHPVMATHRAQGKRTVYVDGDALVARCMADLVKVGANRITLMLWERAE